MALTRGRHCPACGSDNVSVVASRGLKVHGPLTFMAVGVVASFLGGYAVSRMARQSEDMADVAQYVKFWNLWIVTPVAVLLAPVYFFLARTESNKRVCQACGKKWKVRIRRGARGAHEELPASTEQHT